MLRDSMWAESKQQAEEEMEAFKASVFAKAVDRTAAHDWRISIFQRKHLRTSNPVESAFATLRLRQRIAGKALAAMARNGSDALAGAHLLPQVRAGGMGC